jgi:hypothetical protein
MTTKIPQKTISLTDIANVIDTLGLTRLNECHHLAQWMQSVGKISVAYQEILEVARKNLILNRSNWNEEELKMKFISPVIAASEIEVLNQIQVFYERPLSGTLQGYSFSIICDCIVASPTQGGRPKEPYFFLQEFKKEKGDRNDPEAQMLVAMLLSQQANNDGKPVYGAWLQGENWYFCVLNGIEYCRSRLYAATDAAQLEKIVFMLQYLKELILNR